MLTGFRARGAEYYLRTRHSAWLARGHFPACAAYVQAGGSCLARAEVLLDEVHHEQPASGFPGDRSAGWHRDHLPLAGPYEREPFDPAGQAADARCLPGSGREQVLDAGCGLGHEVFRLAERIGPQGRVVGIDAKSAMVTEAPGVQRA
jgi:Methyltransferase domain